jgi:hypothetical protein
MEFWKRMGCCVVSYPVGPNHATKVRRTYRDAAEVDEEHPNFLDPWWRKSAADGSGLAKIIGWATTTAISWAVEREDDRVVDDHSDILGGE